MRPWTSAVALVALAAAGGGPAAPRPSSPREVAASRADRAVSDLVESLLLAVYGPIEDPELEAYVTAVGERVAVAGGGGRRGWRFRVLDGELAEALALPDRRVFVFRGLLVALDSEAELAGVLAHEVAHVVAGHDAVAPDGLPFAIPEDPGEAWTVLAHERDEELEADQLAVLALVDAGYEPTALASALEALEAADDASGEPPLAGAPPLEEADYPPLETRLASIYRCADGRTGGERGEEPYLRATASLRARGEVRR